MLLQSAESHELLYRIDEELLPTQDDFVNDFGECYETGIDGISVLLYLGGWGSGKSYSGGVKAAILAAINAECGGVVVGPTFDHVMSTAYVSLVECLDRNGIDFTERKGNTPRIILPWGSTAHPPKGWIYFKSADKPRSILGLNLAWAWFDEAGSVKTEDAHRNIMSRIRDKKARLKQYIVTTTGEAPWLYERFELSPEKGYKYYSASTEENVEHVGQGYIDAIRAECTPELAKCYLDGGFLPPSAGRVAHAFDRRYNVRSDLVYDPDQRLIHTLDFNRHPAASLIAQEKGDEIYYIAEIAMPHCSTEDVAFEFVRKFGGHKAGVTISGDPAGRSRNTKSVRSDYEIIRAIYQEAGIFGVREEYRISDPGQRARVNAFNRLCCDTAGVRRLFVHPRCKHFLYDIDTCIWNERGEIDKTILNRKWGWTVSHWLDAVCYRSEWKHPIRKPTVVRAG